MLTMSVRRFGPQFFDTSLLLRDRVLKEALVAHGTSPRVTRRGRVIATVRTIDLHRCQRGMIGSMPGLVNHDGRWRATSEGTRGGAAIADLSWWRQCDFVVP